MTTLVIGAGVVGLAVGRALAQRGREVIVAEGADAIGTGVSSRNSEVIHAGMYYPTGSLRARHCVRGRRLLYAFCEAHGVPHRRCGKLIVATDASEEAKVRGIHAQGLANGVEGLTWLDGDEARRLEPNLACTGALLSEETGIIDSHALMLALQGAIEEAGGAIAFNTSVERLAPGPDGGWEAHFGGAEAGSIEVEAVVNAASFGAQRLALACQGYPPERVPPLVLAKGNYFGCAGKPAFRHLIYPAPVEGGLGTHLTLDLAGRMRFGPDVEWIEGEQGPHRAGSMGFPITPKTFEVDPGRAEHFYASIRRYWPGLPDGALVPDYAGIRPKLTGPGQPAADFVVDGPAEHGLPGLVHLFGIESPGLTSALSLAEEVADRLQ